MNNNVSDKQDQLWLAKFDAALKSLPPEHIQEIVREVREHLYERISQGQTAEQILIEFGDPAVYARNFVDEYSLTQARESKQTIRMFTSVASFTRRSLIACVGLFSASIFALLIISSLVCLTMKVVRPDAVGLWVDLPLSAHHHYVQSGPQKIPLRLGHDHIQFGYSKSHPQTPEILGAWIYLCLIGMALLGYFGLRFTLMRTLTTLVGKRK
jgi:Protein of unknown function (DUF1700)